MAALVCHEYFAARFFDRCFNAAIAVTGLPLIAGVVEYSYFSCTGFEAELNNAFNQPGGCICALFRFLVPGDFSLPLTF